VGYPLVLKVEGEGIIHKSDIGGVVVGIKNSDELHAARKIIEERVADADAVDRVKGFFVQEMAESGKEVILGMSMDDKFGPLIMFGMGGKYVETLKDISFRVMPVTGLDAWEMVQSIKGYPILQGVRGEERVDIEYIVESIQRLSQLVSDVHCLEELDINPFIFTPDREGCKIVDARIKISPAELY